MSRLDSIQLPDYSRREDWVNSITHIVGGVFAVVVIVVLLVRTISIGKAEYIVTSIIYGLTMLTVYVCSSVYHALRPSNAKKAMRIVDHAVINFMIVGTITPYMILAVAPLNKLMGWGLTIVCWVAAIVAVILTFTLFNKTKVVQMVLYMAIGWSAFMSVFVMWGKFDFTAIFLIILGGVAYTIGAILYGIGRKKKYIHAVFHLFVILGSVLHFIPLYLYVFV